MKERVLCEVSARGVDRVDCVDLTASTALDVFAIVDGTGILGGGLGS